MRSTGFSGRTHSDLSKEKMSLSQKKSWEGRAENGTNRTTEEHRKNISIAKSKPEQREITSRVQSKRVRTEEERKKISESVKKVWRERPEVFKNSVGTRFSNPGIRKKWKEVHDDAVIEFAKSLESNGNIVVFMDVKGEERPDIISFDGTRVHHYDLKTGSGRRKSEHVVIEKTEDGCFAETKTRWRQQNQESENQELMDIQPHTTQSQD